MFSPAGVLRYRSKENDFLIEAAYGWDSNVIARVVSPADASTPQGRAYISGEPVIARNLNAVNDLSRPAFHGKRGNTATAKLVLARELKHRVRNNLQLILAMLDRHAAALDDGPPKHGIERRSHSDS
jgi:two-component sensor histidine kinase